MKVKIDLALQDWIVDEIADLRRTTKDKGNDYYLNDFLSWAFETGEYNEWKKNLRI